LLLEVMQAVLETMFFVAPMGPVDPEENAAVVKASVAFRGHPSGTLGVCVSKAAALPLAAGFLGEEEALLKDSQPGEVVCELANMLCGSFVSKLESEDCFELDSPELISLSCNNSHDLGDGPVAVCRSFALEGGFLAVTLRLEADE